MSVTDVPDRVGMDMFTMASKLSQTISKYDSKNKEKNVNCHDLLPLMGAIALAPEIDFNSRKRIALV